MRSRTVHHHPRDGVETARALASAGAEVTLAVRNLEAGRATAADITSTTGNDKVLVAPLDLSDQSSVAAFVTNWRGPLDILVNNAGVMAAPLMRTPQGWEMQFATNHYGHFALALGLHDALAAAGHARVVSVSSSGHIGSGIGFDDIHFNSREYNPWTAYAQSKTANVLFAVEASKRWAADGITVNALMPGAIHTALQRHVSEQELNDMRTRVGGGGAKWKTVEQGAATSVLLASSPLVEGIGGRYFEDSNEAEPHQPGTRTGIADHAIDPAAATRLWDASVETLGL